MFFVFRTAVNDKFSLMQENHRLRVETKRFWAYLQIDAGPCSPFAVAH
jgi:hypothetical protein